MSESNEDESPPYQLIGTGMAVVQTAVLAGVAFVLFDDPLFAAVIGLGFGVGSFLFVPYMIALNASQEDGTAPTSAPASGPIHRGALGFALESAAIVALALRMAMEETLIPVAAALAYAIVASFAASYFLPESVDEAAAESSPR